MVQSIRPLIRPHNLRRLHPSTFFFVASAAPCESTLRPLSTATCWYHEKLGHDTPPRPIECKTLSSEAARLCNTSLTSQMESAVKAGTFCRFLLSRLPNVSKTHHPIHSLKITTILAQLDAHNSRIDCSLEPQLDGLGLGFLVILFPTQFGGLCSDKSKR